MTCVSALGRVALLSALREKATLAAKKKAIDFEASLQQLEALVTEMEKGELSLEESLQAFETGIRLTRECQGRLSEAEQKVQLLLQSRDGDGLQAQPFDTDDSP